MSNLNSLSQHRTTLEWADNFSLPSFELGENINLLGIQKKLFSQLRNYFALAALSRSTSAPKPLTEKANELVFGVRINIEKSIVVAIKKEFKKSGSLLPSVLFKGSFYGCSKKQGVSLRIGLNSCVPTNLCAAACYAHDVLDASPAAVIRGAINYFLAEIYEGYPSFREEIISKLLAHTKKAVRSAETEVKQLQKGWTRGARIRFSHVGEVIAFPQFANDLAKQVQEVSNGSVTCVIYTRHPNAYKLDPNLFVINFTLDESSMQRKEWVPKQARTVFSAFGGRVSHEAEINFLEHHRWVHFSPIGHGSICPTTLPKASNRTCDGVQCNICFIPRS